MEAILLIALFAALLAAAAAARIIWYYGWHEPFAARFRKAFPGYFARPRDPFQRRELMKVLLALDDDALEKLFRLYRDRFGAGAARYARKTHRKWKSGDVRPVTQTFERFMVELPRVMSFDLKCEVLRVFMNEFGGKEQISMSVSLSDWEPKLAPVVGRLVERCWTARLPVEVERRLKWLVEGDMRAAAEVLRHSQADETRLAVATLNEEFAGIAKLFEESAARPRVRHTIKLPAGTIELTVKKG